MLRTVLLVLVVLGLTAALLGAIIDPAVWPTAIVMAVFLGGIVFERRRYGAAHGKPSGGVWRETPERFIDDASGRPVAVWYNDATGERRYVNVEPS